IPRRPLAAPVEPAAHGGRRDVDDRRDLLRGKVLGGPHALQLGVLRAQGGRGVVYMAEQTHPVRRRVALKIIKPGMDTRQVIARLEAERQALALMDHPNIARVLDAGATEGGRPYFLMELVRGIPITEYCDQNHLTINERLDLFVLVCQAVQHAHQKGNFTGISSRRMSWSRSMMESRSPRSSTSASPRPPAKGSPTGRFSPPS